MADTQSRGCIGFNTQPPEGGWLPSEGSPRVVQIVSTHSRLKAAGRKVGRARAGKHVSTHSRLKAAGPHA